MGDYSVICAVSGLPITMSQKVVGFEVEHYRYGSEKNQFVPKSFPVFGKYDMVGGIDGIELSPNVALIHLSVWENAELYWHKQNNKIGENFIDVNYIIEKAMSSYEMEIKLQNICPSIKYIMTKQDCVYNAIGECIQDSDEGLVLRDMLESKNDNVTNLPENLSFLHRSTFAKVLIDKMIIGWTEQDQDTLYRLICLYSGQMITGKFIAPSNQPYIEQYPDYKQRIKLLNFHSGLAKKLQKELL